MMKKKGIWFTKIVAISLLVAVSILSGASMRPTVSTGEYLSIDARVVLAANTATVETKYPAATVDNFKMPTFVAQPPISFSETSDYIKLGFTTFTVEFYKGTYGYNKVYDRAGNVLVYDDRAVVEYFKGNKWSPRGVPYSLYWERVEYDGDRPGDYYYKVYRHYTDYLGTTYTLTYTVKSGEAMKLKVTLNSAQTDTYRIAWYLSGIQKATQKAENTRLVFGDETVLYDWIAFDWNDVYDSLGNITTATTEAKPDGIKASIYFNIGNVQAGKSITLDPTYVGNGTLVSGTGAVTPPLPAGIVTNDILLLVAESNTNEAVTIADSKGGTWTEVTSSPQNSTTSRLTVFWSRYNGTQTAPTTNDPGDHICAAILAWTGCITTGNPWDVTSGAVHDVSDTAVSIPGATTTVDNCLVVAIVGHGRDSTKESVNAWANASLNNLVERVDYCTNAAGGGGFGIAEGGKATAGAYNSTTATLAAASTKGLMTIALRPPIAPSPPTNLASPSQTETTIDLTWTIGTNSDKTLIRFRDDQYPTSVTDGNLAYLDTGESVTVGAVQSITQEVSNSTTPLGAPWQLRAGERVNSFPIDNISRVSFLLLKVGSPTGTAYVRIRKVSDDSILATIAEKDVSTLATTATWYNFDCNVNNPTVQDLRFTVEYDGGGGADYIQLRHQLTDVLANAVLTQYTASWEDKSTWDCAIKIYYGTPLQPATTYYFRAWGYESYGVQYSATTADLTQATSGAPPEADISIPEPTSKVFGVVAPSSSYWASGSEPSWPLDDGECYFTVINNGADCDITVKSTNFLGGTTWTLTGDSPGQNTVRLKAGKSGDANEAAMVTIVLANTEYPFITGLPTETSKKWEVKLETGTSTDGVPKTATITLTASLP